MAQVRHKFDTSKLTIISVIAFFVFRHRFFRSISFFCFWCRFLCFHGYSVSEANKCTSGVSVGGGGVKSRVASGIAYDVIHIRLYWFVFRTD